jgi:hypothetical protein
VQTNYTSMGFVQQPTNTNLGNTITPGPTIAVMETDTLLSTNNTDGVSGVPITLSYSDGSSNLITGALTQTTAGGVASYGDFTPGDVAAGAFLSTSITVYGLDIFTATSNNFNVIGPGTQFAVSVPSTATAGTSFPFTVTAEDAAGNPTPNYSGTVHFTTSDPATGVVLPVDSTITGGTGTFNATLITAGSQVIRATDTVNSSLSAAHGRSRATHSLSWVRQPQPR